MRAARGYVDVAVAVKVHDQVNASSTRASQAMVR